MPNDVLGNGQIFDGAAANMAADLTSSIVELPDRSVVSLQLYAPGATHVGTIAIQVSNDKVNWNALSDLVTTATSTSPASGTAFNYHRELVVAARFLRVVYTATSGTGALSGWVYSKEAGATADAALALIKARTDNLDVALSALTVAKATTGAVTQVASSASNVTLKAANTARRGLAVFNDSAQYLYIKLGATASSTSYTVRLDNGGYYEIPAGYTGIVDGIWAAANGNAYVTELT